MVAVESFVLDHRHCGGLAVEEHSLMGFYERAEFGGQFDNWVAPTVRCLMALCRSAGFAGVELNNVHPYGAAVTCRRKWSVPEHRPAEAIALRQVYHNTNQGINFSSTSSDDYVVCWVEPGETALTTENVQPEMGGYGSLPTFVKNVDGHWQVDFKVPPGLTPGWHEVTVRVGDRMSNPMRVAVDIPVSAPGLAIHGIANALTFQESNICIKDGLVTIWLLGAPENADRNNIEVYLGKRRIPVVYGGPAAVEGWTQVNAQVPPGMGAGRYPLWVRIGEDQCEPVTVDVTG
jgi:hypothetical protein